METLGFAPQDWREWRRLRALALTQQGWHQRDAAAALGVREETVSRWVAALITRHASSGPRPGVLAAIGAIPDFPSVEELRSGYGRETPREEME